MSQHHDLNDVYRVLVDIRIQVARQLDQMLAEMVKQTGILQSIDEKLTHDIVGATTGSITFKKES